MFLRHGDLNFKKVKNIPKEAKETKNSTLALGEHTGHHHTLVKGKYKIYDVSNGEKYLEIETPSELTHQEHKKITFPKGRYHMWFEKEYDPFTKAIKQVQD